MEIVGDWLCTPVPPHGCEQARALDAGRHCNTLNHNVGSLQKVINIARRFTGGSPMPAGTPSDTVLVAAREFAREHFALKHRYAMALHTDEPHPHVHMVVKAVSEQGVRMNIRGATLREWRREFARHLRQQGVPANATERAVRRVTKSTKRDGIYRAMRRGESTYRRARVQAAAAEIVSGRRRHEPGKATLVDTRKEVRLGWLAVSDVLVRQGRPELAVSVRRFVDNMQTPRTDREQMTADFIQYIQKTRARHIDREALSR